jgi:hypothetical protein
MNLTATADNKLWGIYHTDREHAHTFGDTLRTTIEAPTKIAAEEAAAKLGFTDPLAHPVAPEVVKLTELVLKRPSQHQQHCGRKFSRGIHI